jgi:endonuclease I
MCKKIIFLFVFLYCANINAQYYAAAGGISGGNPLKLALHNIIKGHSSIGYAGLWNAFTSTDTKPNGKVWDIYSYKFVGPQPYEYTHFTDQCGNYNNEGDCYNREHSWPQSYFNSAEPMESDLFHVYPTDGEVNGIRGNLPYGNVNVANIITDNGSKRGTSSTYSNGSIVFEPIDSFKGDVARTYFYMNTRYTLQGSSWSNWEMANGPELTTDAITLLLNWHHLDPVSQKEVDRNNAIYVKQGNRNPFIDNPIYADCIWGIANCSTVGLQHIVKQSSISISPNPTSDFLQINVPDIDVHNFVQADLYNIYGQIVQTYRLINEPISIKNLETNMYYLQIKTKTGVVVKQFLKL